MYHEPGDCPECGRALEPLNETWYACPACWAAETSRVREEVARGDCYDLEDLLAEARGGPRARTRREKEHGPA